MRRLSPASVLPYATGILSLCLIWLLIFTLQNPVSLDDGLRHFAMARFMSEQGISAATWSQFFSDGYFAHHTVDPWFLSNVALVPFVSLGPVLGLKLFALFCIALLILSFCYTCSAFRTSPVVSTVGLGLLLFFDPTFFYRLLLARPYELITPFVPLIIVGAIQKRAFLVGVSLALCVLLSQLFIFPLLIALCALLWRVSLRQWREALALVLWIMIGMLVGFLLHPHSLQYALYIRDTFVHIPLLPGVQLGLEMQSGFFLGARVLVMIGLLTLLHAELFKEGMILREYRESGLFLLALLTFFFSVLFLLWVRSIDFLWPILIVFLILLESVSPGIFLRTMQRIIPRKFCPRLPFRLVIVFLLLGSVFLSITYTLLDTDTDRSLEPYIQALRNIPAGSRMLTVDWHFFMPAVLVRPDLRYATGIDPSYTYLDNPAAFQLLASLTTPAFQESPTESDVRVWLQEILELYPSDYVVFFRDRHAAMTRQLEQGLQMKNVSESESFSVVRAGT